MLAVLGSTWACLVLACGGAGPAGKSQPTEADREKVAPELQAKRSDMIQRMIQEGVFKTVDTGGGKPPVVQVTPAFDQLDFEDKRNFVAVVAAYAYKIPEGGKLRSGEVVNLVNSKTGKPAGYLDLGGLHLE